MSQFTSRVEAVGLFGAELLAQTGLEGSGQEIQRCPISLYETCVGSFDENEHRLSREGPVGMLAVVQAWLTVFGACHPLEVPYSVCQPTTQL